MFPTVKAERIALKHYGLAATAKTLVGTSDFNFYLKAVAGEAFVLKISRKGEDFQKLDLQNKAFQHLAKKELPFNLPELIPNIAGESITVLPEKEGKHLVRMLRWVPGRLFAKVNPHSPELLKNLGRCCGLLCAGLQDFEHPAARFFSKWDVSKAVWVKALFPLFQQEKQRKLAGCFFQLFEKEALPKLGGLRQSIIHNDANDYNVLVSADVLNPRVCGLIDFGDIVHTNTINELAIATTYVIMGKPDPLAAAASLVSGFHEKFPLEEAELAVLFPLIAARLLVSVTHSAVSKTREPDNEYLSVSEGPAWNLLEKLQNIPPNLAHYSFRFACGLEPCPKNPVFKKWLQKKEDAASSKGSQGKTKRTDDPFFAEASPFHLSKILGSDFKTDKCRRMDLSVGSLDLGNNENFETAEKFSKKITELLEQAGAETGIGGYGEARPFYTTDAYQVEGNDGPKWRSMHLGVDLWTKPESPVFAPLDGKIHSFQNNAGDCNYGPTIILEHRVSRELTFYSLYGHLSLPSLKGLEVGMEIKKGQRIATIGNMPENGNWPPHLHFQIMLDMLEMKGDFPGAAFPNERAVWLSICPNAALVSTLEGGETALSTEDILRIRTEHLGKSLSISYSKPLKIVRGYLQYLYDDSGRRYLDAVNNVAHVGHEHPRVVRAAQRQLAVLNTNTRYLHQEIIRFAEELLATFPPNLCVVHFVNSGSEANELALRMARTFTGQQDMVVVEGGYHGNTGACIDISSYKFDGKGGKGAPPFVHAVPIPDTFGGLYRKAEPNVGKNYAAHVQHSIEKVQQQGKGIAGFICESILSCGGQIVLPEGYLKAAYHHIRDAGGVCMADEVQVGFGRPGASFWGFELQGVVPDIVTMGKPVGNGHPLAAVVTTREIAEAFANGMEYFNTFGGNPVSCAIGREVLRIIREENLQANALEVGSYLINNLKDLQKRHPIIGDLRGTGLFLGIELVKNPETLAPASPEATYLVNRMREHGILTSADGPFHNVLKIKPPMCFNKTNSDFLVEMLDKVLKEDFLRI